MRRSRPSRSREASGRFGTLLIVALVLVATVGALGTTPTTAFTSGTLSRGSSAAVADDTNGLLGLDVADSVAAGTSDRLVTVTNQLDRTVSVTVALDGGAGSLSNAQTTLAPGESITSSVTVDCTSPPDTIEFTVEATSGSQFTGTASRTTSIDTSGCSSGSGPIEFVPGSAASESFSGPSGGSTGSLSFALENTEQTARTITAFEIESAGSATALSHDGPPPENGEPGKDEVYIDATGGATASEGIAESSRGDPPYAVGTDTTYALDQPVTFDPGERAQISLYKFVRNGNAYQFHTGDSVVITLTLQDGTQVTVQFSL